MDKVGQVIRSLYRGASTKPLGVFRSWALQEISEVIPFDSGIYGTGNGETMAVHNAVTFNLTDDFLALLLRHAHLSPAFESVIKNPGKAYALTDFMTPEAFLEHPFYLECSSKADIRHVLSMTCEDEHKVLKTLLSLYRTEANKPFTEADKSALERISYHLGAACSLSIVNAMQQRHLNEVRLSASSMRSVLVSDVEGHLWAGEDEAIAAIKKEVPDWNGQQIPSHENLKPYGTIVTCGRVAMRAMPIGKLEMIEVWAKSSYDELTSEEEELGRKLYIGLPLQAAANELGMEYHSAERLRTKLYKKLGVKNLSGLKTTARPHWGI